MTPDVTEVIKAAAVACYPNEACGYIIAVSDKKAVAVQCMNVSATPRNHFMIPVRETARCRQLGDIIGVWHTHVEQSPRPSIGDKGGCEMTGIPWQILAIYKTENGFRFDGPILLEPSGFVMDYVGRPYIVGVYDCYSLLQDFYRREFSIELGDYERGEHTFKGQKNHILDNYASEGFKPVEKGSSLQVGDVLIMQAETRMPGHIGIYLGNDLMVHHCRGRLSRRDVYGGYWHTHTHIVLRHESQCSPK